MMGRKKGPPKIKWAGKRWKCPRCHRINLTELNNQQCKHSRKCKQCGYGVIMHSAHTDTDRYYYQSIIKIESYAD
ncbi:MAG: hypothetical protein AMJ75_00510 [Phycisphaerae bacterium SM1_79]|nr:MAG: hypothetical protein AMJ75_00510 [Phycisphaerae bacterium SM1_79]